MCKHIKEGILIVSTVIVACVLLMIASYEIGKDATRREAVVAGHALWAYDQHGYPQFHWKEQQTVIGEYLGLGK